MPTPPSAQPMKAGVQTLQRPVGTTTKPRVVEEKERTVPAVADGPAETKFPVVEGIMPAEELLEEEVAASLAPGTSDFKVGAQSNIKKVAGTIAHTCRDFLTAEVNVFEGTFQSQHQDIVCRLVAGGNAAINQAVKSIAIARQYLLKDEQEIWVQPFFESFGAVYLEIRSQSASGKRDKKLPDLKDEGQSSTMRAAMASDPYRLAGAIAEQIRNSTTGSGVAILAQGKGAVSQAVRSIIYARGYLRAEKIDLQFQPSFMHVPSNQASEKSKSGQETRSVIRFQISQFAIPSAAE